MTIVGKFKGLHHQIFFFRGNKTGCPAFKEIPLNKKMYFN